MATNTNGGTTTSLDNTPQAKDDFYTASEDQVLYFCVMENDLGGNAKTLWSVDNTSDDGSADLVAKDVAGVSEYSELGAKISLTSDGRIKYDTTLLDGLAEGQTVTDQFTYAIRLSNGTLSWATVTVTLTGTNDGPVAVNDVASGNEDSSISGSVATNDSDVDAGAVLSFAVNGTAPAGFTMDGDGNWTLDASDPAYQHIAAGATEEVIVSYTVTDEHGATATATLTITVHGVNDAPVAASDEAAVAEDATIGGSVAGNDDDVDDGASLTYALVDPAPEGLTFNTDGSWTFDASSYDSLAQDEELVLTIPYTVTDEHGESDSSTLTITVTGTNDAPVAVADEAAVDEDLSIGGSVATNDSDVDNGASLTYALVDPAPEGLTFNADGSWTFDASSYDSLAQDEELVLTIPYTVTDEHGESDSSTLTITVTGTNDAPVAVADEASGHENEVLLIDVLANDTDADGGAVLTVTDASAPAGQGTASVVSNQVQFDPGTDFDYLADGATTVVTISYTIVDEHGASSNSTIEITVTGTNDAPTLANPADGSVAEVDQSGTTNALGLSGTLDGDDVDGDGLTYGIDGGTDNGDGTVSKVGSYGTLTVNTSTGAYNYVPDPAAIEALDDGETPSEVFDVTVSDGNGPLVTQSYAVNVTGADDAPTLAPIPDGSIAEIDQSASTTESGLSGTLDGDDVDGDALAYGIEGGGSSSLAGYDVAKTGTYGTLYVNSVSGAYLYVPDATAIEALDQGENPSDSFDVTVSDGDDAPVKQTYTVNLTGGDEVIVVTPPPTYNGGGDENDFDDAGPAAGSTITKTGSGTETWNGTNNGELIDADNGTDIVYGHDGNDTIDGDNGADISLYGQRGNDTIYGGQGGDRIYGGSGDDILFGRSPPAGDQTQDAGDEIYGGSGNDTIYGQGGNDIIIGGYGGDTLTGGDGNDTFVYLSVLDTNDTILDFMAGDQIDLSELGLTGWSGATPTANSLWMVESGGSTTLFADTDGNAATAEFMLTLQGFTGFDPMSPPPSDIIF